MSTPTYTRTEPALDPAREVALGMAIAFHEDTDTDDPQAVVDTAKEFLTFLQGGNERMLRGPASL